MNMANIIQLIIEW